MLQQGQDGLHNQHLRLTINELHAERFNGLSLLREAHIDWFAARLVSVPEERTQVVLHLIVGGPPSPHANFGIVTEVEGPR